MPSVTIISHMVFSVKLARLNHVSDDLNLSRKRKPCDSNVPGLPAFAGLEIALRVEPQQSLCLIGRHIELIGKVTRQVLSIPVLHPSRTMFAASTKVVCVFFFCSPQIPEPYAHLEH